MRIPKSKALYGVCLAVLVLLCGGITAYAAHKTVTVKDNGQRSVIRGFTFGNVGSFLKEHGVAVTSIDRVEPGVSSKVQDGMTVVVESPKTIQLVDATKTTHKLTFAKTVKAFLADNKVKLGKQDTMNVSLSSSLKSGERVEITRRSTKVSTKTQAIPFRTERQRTNQLYIGETRRLTHGVQGLMQIQTTSVFVNGHNVRHTVRHKVLKPAVNEVDEIGIAPRPFVLSARGVGSVTVIKQITVLATAYPAGGHTYTGWTAGPGVIAVDPSVIPLGSKLYIPGIGVVYAEDIGSAIQGNRIDICMATRSEAEEWGLREVTVYIIH